MVVCGGGGVAVSDSSENPDPTLPKLNPAPAHLKKKRIMLKNLNWIQICLAIFKFMPFLNIEGKYLNQNSWVFFRILVLKLGPSFRILNFLTSFRFVH